MERLISLVKTLVFMFLDLLPHDWFLIPGLVGSTIVAIMWRTGWFSAIWSWLLS